jgi:MSHA biogenesis protein MshJ
MKQQLLQQWLKLSSRLDAMTLRERAMVFLAVLASILFLLYTFAIEPMLARQKMLQSQIKQQQNQIAGIDGEITFKVQSYAADPNAPLREHLQSLQQQIDQSSAGLMAMQKGLVAPDKIAPLLEHLLRGNGKLRLMSMKTLPVTGMNEATQLAPKTTADAAGEGVKLPAPGLAALTGALAPATTGAPAAAPAAAAPKPRELLYRHGVEIVLQGSYTDMVSYMDALEALPVQLFWGKAALDAQQYPNSRLTLTLYTLSLDSKWMKL